MSRVLLDTHVLLWALMTPKRLSRAARALLVDPQTRVLVSSVTAWEIATKHRLGKLPEASAVVTDYRSHLDRFLAEELPITTSHALRAGAFPQAHRDPFDRMLAAQGLLEDLPLLTDDPVFAQFPIRTLW